MIFASAKAHMESRYYWSIQPIYSLVMLFGTLLCLSLGIWQFEKSKQFEHKDVPSFQLTGVFLPAPNLLLDNRTHAGQPGYHLYSVFVGQRETYLVNRGFIGAQATRDLAPEFTQPSGQVSLTGKLLEPATPLILSKKNSQSSLESMSTSLYRVQRISLPELSETLGFELENKVLQLTEGQGLLTPIEVQAPYMNQHKHMAYAVQWWLLMIAAVVIWLVSSLKRAKTSE